MSSQGFSRTGEGVGGGGIRRWLARGLAAAAAVAAAAAAGAEGRGESGLGPHLEAALRAPALEGAKVSALVVRERDGQVLYERSADRLLVPASNLKLLTALGALSELGPTHRFETPVRAPAPPDAEGAVSHLSVEGRGDPVLNSEDWWRLASALRQRGLRRVRGGIVVDDAAFDRVRWHPSWGAVSSRAYHAPVGALNANYGSFSVRVEAGDRPGEAARVSLDPPVDYLRLSARVETGPPRKRSSVVIDRRQAADHELVVARGQIPAGAEPRVYYRSVLDPSHYAGSVLAMQLRAVGIRVDGPVRVGSAGEDAHELLRFEGRPLAEVVRLFMKYSNNMIAETLVKGLALEDGRVGSWKAGIPGLSRILLGLGLPADSFSLVDGSGLSTGNRVSPRALVAALRLARRDFRIGPELLASLPIAARDGTLAERAGASAGRVRAKTGLLNRVVGLSGYAEAPDGEWRVFSVLVNGYRSGDDGAMRALDRFAARVADGSVPVPAKGDQERPSGGAS